MLAGTGPLAGEVTVAAAVSLPTATFALSGTVAKTSAVFLRRRQLGGRRQPGPWRWPGSSTSATCARPGGPAPDPAGNDLPAIARLVTTGLARAGADRRPAWWWRASNRWSPWSRGTRCARSTRPGSTRPRWPPASGSARRAGSSCGEYLTAVTPPRPRAVTSPFVSVLHVDDVGTVDWHGGRRPHPDDARASWPSPGELIVSLLNPARLRAAVIPPGAPVQISAEFGVFRCRCDPYAALGLLYSPPVRAQLRPLGTGTSSSRRRIEAADVLALIVPKRDHGRARRPRPPGPGRPAQHRRGRAPPCGGRSPTG